MLLDKCVNVAPWNKLCKKSLIKKYSFSQDVYYEDLQVTLLWILKSKKTIYVSEPLYYYVARKESVTSDDNYSNEIQFGIGICKLVENLAQEDLLKKYNEHIYNYIFSKLLYFLTRYVMKFIDNVTVDIISIKESLTANMVDWKKMLSSSSCFDKYEKKMLYNFLAEDNYIKKLYEKSKIDMHKLFYYNNVAMWGWGNIGKELLKYFIKFDVRPKYIIDSDKDLNYSYVDDIIITSFEKVKKCDFVVVSIKDYTIFNEIKKEINRIDNTIKVVYYAELLEI